MDKATVYIAQESHRRVWIAVLALAVAGVIGFFGMRWGLSFIPDPPVQAPAPVAVPVSPMAVEPPRPPAACPTSPPPAPETAQEPPVSIQPAKIAPPASDNAVEFAQKQKELAALQANLASQKAALAGFQKDLADANAAVLAAGGACDSASQAVDAATAAKNKPFPKSLGRIGRAVLEKKHADNLNAALDGLNVAQAALANLQKQVAPAKDKIKSAEYDIYQLELKIKYKQKAIEKLVVK